MMSEDKQERIEVYAVRKNAREDLRFALTHYGSQLLCDIRIWYENESGTLRASKKGITVRPEMLPELRKGIEALEDVLKGSEEKKSK